MTALANDISIERSTGSSRQSDHKLLFSQWPIGPGFVLR